MQKSVELNEIVKTVRFGMKTLQSKRKKIKKNNSYQEIANKFKDNKEIATQLNKYVNRINQSSNLNEWKDCMDEFIKNIESLEKLVNNIQESLVSLDKIKSDSKCNLKIRFKVNVIKKSCGFGKNLFFSVEERYSKSVKLCEFTELKQLENVKKYSDGQYNNCKSNFEAYKIYIENNLKFTKNKIAQLRNLLSDKNYEKARLVEIYLGFKQVLFNLNLVNVLFYEAIIFDGGQWEEGEKLRVAVSRVKKTFVDLKREIEEAIEKIYNPRHGYAIGKATLHYRTINKRFVPNYKKQDIQKLLGKDSCSGGEFNNPLAKFSNEILNAFKGKVSRKGTDRRLEIVKGGSVVEKAQKILEIVSEINGVEKENVTLWNVCNALNNKKQAYHKFITQEESLENLGWKQKLKFCLTILVGCDVYKLGKLYKWECKRYNDAEKYLDTVGFKEYLEYKGFTQKIHKPQKPNFNAKERGKLITGHLNRDFILVNREISQIRGALGNYLSYLQNNEVDFNAIQYFVVLGKDADDHDLALLVEREQAKEFYEKITGQLKSGKEKLYLYDSLTAKALKKLFNQFKSEEHPFLDYKTKLLIDKKNKEFDQLKFDDLSKSEIIELLKKDIALKEKWKENFSKFYKKLENNKFCGNKQDLLKTLTKDAFFFQEKSFNLNDLQSEFDNMIVAQLKMNTNQEKKSNHKNYFERAVKKMLKHEDVDAKINPEFQIYYKPQQGETEKQAKIKQKKGKINLEQLKNNHRFWRDQVTLGIPVEIYSKRPSIAKGNITRVIGIDRGERKIGTLCHLEKSNEGQFILPIEYYEENNLNDMKMTYFLDLANFKVGRLKDGRQVIIKTSNNVADINMELKKYEFITRFVKTIWMKNNRENIQKILGKFKDHQDLKYISVFIEGLIHTKKEKEDGTHDGKFFNNHGLKIYQKRILGDKMVLSVLSEIINNFNDFNFKNKEKDLEKIENGILIQKNLELQKVKLRDVVAAYISGIVNFLFKENKKQLEAQTFCALENLHNSNCTNFASKNVITDKKEINEDFVEATHNKLYQTSVYAKVEQAILNKLQVYNDKDSGYLDYVYEIKGENQKKKYIPIKQIQLELKRCGKEGKSDFEEFQGRKIEIKPAKFYGNVVFVDPFYTSMRCPKCNQKQLKGFRKEDDLLSCKKGQKTSCGFNSKESLVDCNSNLGKVNVNEAWKVIHNGDENGAFFIGYRCLHSLLNLKKFNKY